MLQFLGAGTEMFLTGKVALVTGGGTGIGKDPETMEQNIIIAGGGTEADSLMARRILMDLHSGDGTGGSKIPLLLI